MEARGLYAKSLLAAWRVRFAWEKKSPARPHSLPAPLIVSLTSHSRRFPQLHLTLKCLLSQTVRPDAVILWIAHDDMAFLPPDVLALEANGLTVRPCRDLRSYTKFFFAVGENPDAYIVTADDDTYYWPTWLEELLAGHVPDECATTCHRAHRIRCDSGGMPLPYIDWDLEVGDAAVSPLLFATGVGGVLYPPGILHPDVTDLDRLSKLCPSADDVWLYWMTRRTGALVRKVGPRRRFLTWPSSQTTALMTTNMNGGANDAQIENMIAAYGWPPEVCV